MSQNCRKLKITQIITDHSFLTYSQKEVKCKWTHSSDNFTKSNFEILSIKFYLSQIVKRFKQFPSVDDKWEKIHE